MFNGIIRVSFNNTYLCVIYSVSFAQFALYLIAIQKLAKEHLLDERAKFPDEIVAASIQRSRSDGYC